MGKTHTFYRIAMPPPKPLYPVVGVTVRDCAEIVFLKTEAPACAVTIVDDNRVQLGVERSYLAAALRAVREFLPITVRVDGSEWEPERAVPVPDRAQELWDERRQILQDAGADEFELIKHIEALQAKLAAAEAALRDIAAGRGKCRECGQLADMPSNCVGCDDMRRCAWEPRDPEKVAQEALEHSVPVPAATDPAKVASNHLSEGETS